MSDSSSFSQGKRPYATLDLKATEIKVTPIGERFSTASEPALMPASAVPRPLPARAYALPAAAQAKKETVRPAAAAPAAASVTTAAAAAMPPTQTAAPASSAAEAPQREVIIKKRGGFFSHLAASLIGGMIALGAWQWGLPHLAELGLLPVALRTQDDALVQRLAKLEKAQGTGDVTANLQAAELRLADLEKTAAKIGEMKDAQTRFIAETKATLAAAASDAGASDELARLAAIEGRIKAMTDAGVGDPNAGRMEQLAALTGKVSDLETSLATQLTALRKSVAGDVEARITAATEAAEAAKSGTQRIDRDIAAMKSDAAKIDERLTNVKGESDRHADLLKRSEGEFAAVKKSLETLTASVAKPADVTAAVSPVSAKIASVEAELKTLQKADSERRTNAERVVLALELQNLKRALDRGQQYSSELAEVEKASAGKLDLAPLARFKEKGVPTVADLTRDFRPSANAIIDAEVAPAEGSVVDRLIAGAKSVVRVRKVSHEPGDTSAEAVAARMEAALKEGRLSDVITEADGLSPKAKDAAAPFLEKVSARATVDKALASLEGQLKSSMSGTSAEPSKTE